MTGSARALSQDANTTSVDAVSVDTASDDAVSVDAVSVDERWPLPAVPRPARRGPS
ncbi:hypothetical protein AB0912_20085 [Streptomyces sp. NPDC007084]|uniref:hypothetical protein n=1 Tax=Streptomyces sp. NPDC007084 TaxID=3154313 RepID=UPI003453C3E3